MTPVVINREQKNIGDVAVDREMESTCKEDVVKYESGLGRF